MKPNTNGNGLKKTKKSPKNDFIERCSYRIICVVQPLWISSGGVALFLLKIYETLTYAVCNDVPPIADSPPQRTET
jgi:hypothetical protein